ncbi:hypothetical protein N9L20_08340 [Flavobacteriaceae bacterium]|nr:hypothetical protein [Flavobacteriaceae bacterium]
MEYLKKLFFLLLIVSCQEDEIVFPYPKIITSEVTILEDKIELLLLIEENNTGLPVNRISLEIFGEGSNIDVLYTENIESEFSNNEIKLTISDQIYEGVSYTVTPTVFMGGKIILTDENWSFKGRDLKEISLSSYSPQRGNWGTEIVLLGEGFEGNTEVRLGETLLSTKLISDKEIHAVVRSGTENDGVVDLTVVSPKKTITSEDSFEFIFPIIEPLEFNPVDNNDDIVISGQEISTLHSRVYLNDQEIDVSLNDLGTEISFTYPLFKSSTLTIEDYGKALVENYQINYKDFEIFSISNTSLSDGQMEFEIKGAGFPKGLNLTLKPTNGYWENVHASNTEVLDGETAIVRFDKFDFPISLSGFYEEYNLLITNAETGFILLENDPNYVISVSFDGMLEKVSTFPGTPRLNASSWVHNESIYFGFGETKGTSSRNALNDLWEYQILEDRWERKSDFPGEARVFSAEAKITNQFVRVGGKPDSFLPNVESMDGYVFEAYSDVYAYDIPTDTWIQRADYVEPGFGGYAYNLNGALLVGNTANRFGQSEFDEAFYKFRSEMKSYTYDSSLDNWTLYPTDYFAHNDYPIFNKLPTNSEGPIMFRPYDGDNEYGELFYLNDDNVWYGETSLNGLLYTYEDSSKIGIYSTQFLYQDIYGNRFSLDLGLGKIAGDKYSSIESFIQWYNWNPAFVSGDYIYLFSALGDGVTELYKINIEQAIQWAKSLE